MIKLTKLKQLREQKGLSQKKLARIADVSNNTVVNIESGKQTSPKCSISFVKIALSTGKK